jgi:hypothetical protein
MSASASAATERSHTSRVDPSSDELAGDRCEHCGRTDVDDAWLWLELRRFGDEDCEFDTVELTFCSQAHAAAHLAATDVDWTRLPTDQASGVRADRFFLGCGLVAIVLSVIGLVALVRWLV